MLVCILYWIFADLNGVTSVTVMVQVPPEIKRVPYSIRLNSALLDTTLLYSALLFSCTSMARTHTHSHTLPRGAVSQQIGTDFFLSGSLLPSLAALTALHPVLGGAGEGLVLIGCCRQRKPCVREWLWEKSVCVCVCMSVCVRVCVSGRPWSLSRLQAVFTGASVNQAAWTDKQKHQH